MKGLALSLNAVILVAIAALVLAAFGVFFISASGKGISETEAQRLFAGGCARYCESDLYSTFRNAYLASQNDPGFVAACTRLKYGPPLNRCLERCSNCNLEVTEKDLERGLDNLNAMSSRG